jgi:hypothetical protein
MDNDKRRVMINNKTRKPVVRIAGTWLRITLIICLLTISAISCVPGEKGVQDIYTGNIYAGSPGYEIGSPDYYYQRSYIANLYTWNGTDWTNNITGTPGLPGEQGEQGEQGIQGETGNITLSVAHIGKQESYNNALAVCYAYRLRCGQYYHSWAKSVIMSVQLRLSKVGTPTGTAYCRVRNVSDDSIIATIGQKDVATLPVGEAWVTFDTYAANINEEKDIRIMLEYAGGNASNYVAMHHNLTSVVAGSEMTEYVTSYSETSSWDMAWNNMIYIEVY